MGLEAVMRSASNRNLNFSRHKAQEFGQPGLHYVSHFQVRIPVEDPAGKSPAHSCELIQEQIIDQILEDS
jgi:hypothetical protein